MKDKYCKIIYEFSVNLNYIVEYTKFKNKNNDDNIIEETENVFKNQFGVSNLKLKDYFDITRSVYELHNELYRKLNSYDNIYIINKFKKQIWKSIGNYTFIELE